MVKCGFAARGLDENIDSRIKSIGAELGHDLETVLDEGRCLTILAFLAGR